MIEELYSIPNLHNNPWKGQIGRIELRYWALMTAAAGALIVFLWWEAEGPETSREAEAASEPGGESLSQSLSEVQTVPDSAAPPESASRLSERMADAAKKTPARISTAGDEPSDSDRLTPEEQRQPEVEEILSLWRSRKPLQNSKLFDLLESLGNPDLAARILGQLAEESPQRMQEVLPSRLATIDPELAVRVASDMLFSEHENIRRDAAETLGAWGSAEDVYVLREALNRPDVIGPRESFTLARALDDLGSPAELEDQRIWRIEAFESGTDSQKYGATAQATHDHDLPICFMAANDAAALVRGAGMRCLMSIGESQQALDTVANWEGVREKSLRSMEKRIERNARQENY